MNRPSRAPAAIVAEIVSHVRPWGEGPCPGTITRVRTVLGLSDGERLGFCDVCGRGVAVVPKRI